VVDYQAPRCVLYTDAIALLFTTPKARIWLDSLHILKTRPDHSKGKHALVSVTKPHSHVWATNITWQGDQGFTMGCFVKNSKSLFSGVSPGSASPRVGRLHCSKMGGSGLNPVLLLAVCAVCAVCHNWHTFSFTRLSHIAVLQVVQRISGVSKERACVEWPAAR
jgi:hypothetical protein